MGCLENGGIDKVNEQHGADEERTMGAQEQEHESSLDKGDNGCSGAEGVFVRDSTTNRSFY